MKAKGLLGDLTSRELLVDGLELELTVDQGPSRTAEALRRLDAAGLEVTGIVLREPSLDDVFLSLTGKRTESTDDEQPVAASRRGR
jgi:ABC-2 type transport system ATP-binding protein